MPKSCQKSNLNKEVLVGQIEEYPLSKNLVPMEIWEKRPNQMNCVVHSTTEYTPLHAAAENGRVSTCKLIMDNVLEKKSPEQSKVYVTSRCRCKW